MKVSYNLIINYKKGKGGFSFSPRYPKQYVLYSIFTNEHTVFFSKCLDHLGNEAEPSANLV
jgi:hypothetical protein